MKPRIQWSEHARRDLLEIGDFIARDKPDAATRWTTKLLNAGERTAMFPTSGRVVPEVGRHDIREVILGDYRVVYQLQEHQIIVLTVFESHHLIDGSLADRTDRE